MGASVNIIKEDSLRAVEDGYAFDVRLNWYRSLPLSCIEINSVRLDGEAAQAEQILFEINGHAYSLAELAEKYEEFWFVQDFARLHVRQPGKLRRGETHTLEAEIALRFPYTQIGPGIEVVGFQSFRSYPDVPDDEARHFRNLLDRYGLKPTCLGANIDIGRRRDRLMSEAEIIDMVRRQLVSAQKLGFPIMRVPPSAGGLALENLLPLAEQFKIQLAVELHSPLSVDHPEVVELRHAFERLSSPYLGFIPDFSTSMTSVSRPIPPSPDSSTW